MLRNVLVVVVIIALGVLAIAPVGAEEKVPPILIEPIPTSTPEVHVPYMPTLTSHDVQRLIDAEEAWWAKDCPQVIDVGGELGYRPVKTQWGIWQLGDNEYLCYYYVDVSGVVYDAHTKELLSGVSIKIIAEDCPGDCEDTDTACLRDWDCYTDWFTSGLPWEVPGLYHLGPLFPMDSPYRLTFTRDGYQTLTVDFPILWGLKYKYDVFLVPIE